ncbi:MAG: signal recognition particle-docking protein FtsY [Lachnospiraceae bacterium]|nr:signal recognition particle-docking protein FtsY [Lachnospiraceae bacterium]MCQ2529709.1 signal recognition particle-docking protein FtsY [Lachnospiraceae bacterium]
MGFFSRLFNSGAKIDDDYYEEVEETLFMGDMGVKATEELVESLKLNVLYREVKNQDDAKAFMISKIAEIMTQPEDLYDFENQKSAVLVIGVNGVGKTTSIGKLAKRYSGEGKKVILAGADTFRAAAADQLKIWSERTGCFMVTGNEGSDPGSVVFDAARAAKARGADLMLCDTAGRLHNKKNLMNELAKIDKILAAEFGEAGRTNIIVLDATTGQNALQQAKEFKEIMKVDGVILTKMDGTAKGGIAVAITKELGIPVMYIGVGEGAADLVRFNPQEYAEGLFNE